MADQNAHWDKDILISHIEALSQNLKRIRVLFQGLESSSDTEIREYAESIRGKFDIAVNPLLNQLKALTAKTGEPDVVCSQAWNDYVKIRQEGQRVFAQCLDFLGGVAVRTEKLDQGICDLAELLVKAYARDTGVTWASVMILGEDRLFDDIAHKTQIIRLRFPEWDIWSLPFIAHEFGQLVARSDAVDRLREYLENEERRIKELITGGQIAAETQEKLAGNVATLRQTYQDNPEQRAAIKEFVERQGFHMRSLFADAFAIHFIGPAYIYARLFLRLDPADVLHDRAFEPSLTRRMNFMLGALNKMGRRREKYAQGPYEAEIKRIKDAWKNTVTTMDPTYPEDPEVFTFGEPYDSWFSKMSEHLQSTYEEQFTSEDWKLAQELSDELLQPEPPQTKQGRCLPVIINAAWHCRVREPKRASEIERKVLDLIEKAIANETIKCSRGGTPSQ